MTIADVSMTLFMLMVAVLVVWGLVLLVPRRRPRAHSIGELRKRSEERNPATLEPGDEPIRLRLDELGAAVERLQGLGPLSFLTVELDEGARVQLVTLSEEQLDAFGLNVFATGHGGDLQDVRKTLAEAGLEIEWLAESGIPEFPLVALGEGARPAVRNARKVLASLFGTKKSTQVSIVEVEYF